MGGLTFAEIFWIACIVVNSVLLGMCLYLEWMFGRLIYKEWKLKREYLAFKLRQPKVRTL